MYHYKILKQLKESRAKQHEFVAKKKYHLSDLLKV
jgi:hypothetical protein